MEAQRQVIIALSCMKGGGAERVASLLANHFSENGINCSILLTNSTAHEVKRIDLNSDIPIRLLQNELSAKKRSERIRYGRISIYARVMCSIYERRKKPIPARLAYCSFIWQNYREIAALRRMLLAQPELTVIAFLQPTIPMVLLAAQGLPNRIVISERGDPRRLLRSRYGKPFIEAFYPRADYAVFQTADARSAYPDAFLEKSCMISNPLKSGLPEPFTGQRRSVISTFCRISEQKNLPLLLDAFALLHSDHPAFTLHIIGDAVNDNDKALLARLHEQAADLDISDAVVFLPFSKNVHLDILKDAMYVNSSDYEGMSNSMLEAMAIGLPTICTDCPIGGAHTIIQDHENGILVPVGDKEALYRGMKELIENPHLAQTLSGNGAKLRKELHIDRIAGQWMELV